MSFRANRLRHSPPDDEGYILPTVIVVLTVGAMVAIALLGYAAALLKAGGDDADSVLHLYAADAGITTMKHLLERGTVTPPEPFMFGDDIEVKVGVTPITTSHAPLPTHTVTPHPIDPGLPDLFDEDQYPVAVIIESVPRGTELNVRWQYSLLPPPPPQATSTPPTASVLQPTNTPTPPDNSSPAPTPTQVPPPIQGREQVAEGTPRPTPIVSSTPCLDGQLDCVVEITTEPLDLPEEVEDIEFVFDPGEDEVSTLPFARTCTDRRIRSYFCLTAKPQHYVVVSTTGNATVTAYILQFPGWCESPSGGFPDGATHYERCDDVEILSWKPYPPNPTPTPNSDDEQDEAPGAPNE